jgi:hypothetical protein
LFLPMPKQTSALVLQGQGCPQHSQGRRQERVPDQPAETVRQRQAEEDAPGNNVMKTLYYFMRNVV